MLAVAFGIKGNYEEISRTHLEPWPSLELLGELVPDGKNQDGIMSTIASQQLSEGCD